MPGDLVAFPAGTAIAHTIVNRSDEDAELLVVGERKSSERVFYPEDRGYDTWYAAQHPLRVWESPDRRDESSVWPPVRIETERLVLRPWSPDDAHSLLASQIRNQAHLARFMTWAHPLPTLDELYARILGWQIQKPGQREVVYGVFSPEGHILGGTGYHDRVGELGLEIGYWVDFEAEGKGYVTEWVAALTRLGIEVLGLDRIEIHCSPRNTRSAAVPGRLGFTCEGTLPRRTRGADGQPEDSQIFCLYASAYPDTPCANAQVKAWDGLGRRLL